jgi:hypothetical protein
LAHNEWEKLALPNVVDKKLQICKMCKLHIFVITNMCKQIFVTFGRIGPRAIFVTEVVHREVVGGILGDDLNVVEKLDFFDLQMRDEIQLKWSRSNKRGPAL